MIRRQFIKLAAASAGSFGLPRLVGASFGSVFTGDALFLSAEIGVFFPSLWLIRRLQEEPWLSFVMVEHDVRQFEVGLRFPAALENSSSMNETDRALVEQKLMAGLLRELPRHPGGVRLEINPGRAFFHPYLADAQHRAVFCRVTAA
jgi:hypothetical protein